LKINIINEEINQYDKSAIMGCTPDIARYQLLRTFNPQQFSALWEENLNTGKPFDELLDEMIYNKDKHDI
jgi:hypothetical protein